MNQETDASINEAHVWKEDSEPIYTINGDIKFDNVNFVYPSRPDAPVLRNLSLIARAGQTTALVGSSGCGKSCIIIILLHSMPFIFLIYSQEKAHVYHCYFVFMTHYRVK